MNTSLQTQANIIGEKRQNKLSFTLDRAEYWPLGFSTDSKGTKVAIQLPAKQPQHPPSYSTINYSIDIASDLLPKNLRQRTSHYQNPPATKRHCTEANYNHQSQLHSSRKATPIVPRQYNKAHYNPKNS